MTYADTQATYKNRAVWASMRDQVASGTMPQDSKLTDAEKATLTNWFAYGALGSTKSCSSNGTGGTGGSAGDGGSGGSAGSIGGAGGSGGSGGKGGTGGTSGKGGTGGTGGKGGTGGTGGTGGAPQCDGRYKFTAHAAGNISAKYPVPNPTSDLYVCFTFNSPFAAGELATAMTNIIDDTRVIHHWILYGNGPSSTLQDGNITTGLACQLETGSGTHITGWAPGGNSTVLPSDVGLKLDYKTVTLQVHYNNNLYADGADASGVELCTTKSGRPNVAGIVVLGKSPFSIPGATQDATVTGTCPTLSTNGQTLTVIGTSPHMHRLGTGFVTEHWRGSLDTGTRLADLSNIPLGTWSFENQKHYPVDRVQILPGDQLRTTCHYNNPNGQVNFGPRTSDEMCYDFITVYPIASSKEKCGPSI